MRHASFVVVGTIVLLFCFGALASAQQGRGNPCTPAGTWYGGSVVAYRITITPAEPAGHFSVLTEAMYKNSVISTTWTGQISKSGKIYQGSMSALSTQDPQYMNPPPFTALPDIAAGWFTFELKDCNTMKSVIPFLGLYSGAGIWEPGTPWTGIKWLPNAKVPLIDPPDMDLIPFLTGDTKPIVETYHRVLNTVNPALLHN